MTQKDINNAIEISVSLYGRDATIAALNKMYHAGIVTAEQLIKALDALNK